MANQAVRHPAETMLAELTVLQGEAGAFEDKMAEVARRMCDCHLDQMRLMAEGTLLGLRIGVIKLQLHALGIDA